MTYASGLRLTDKQIETINAHGPYNHGAWSNGSVVVTNEEALTGRADFLAATARRAILDRYDVDELRSMTIVDVGCYDGWLLEQGLADLPFARMVGIEPREKNILKGHVVRDVLGIPTRSEYMCRGLENLPDERYDIVLCAGVLHHVESPGPPLRALREITGRLLLLETHVLPSHHLTERLRDDLELKDVVYRYTDPTFGVSGQKFESSYYDGSADIMSVVSISSIETLRMHLAAAAFPAVDVVASPSDYHADGQRRMWEGAFLAAIPGDELREESWIVDYEARMANTVLPMEVIGPLYDLVDTDRLDAAVAELAFDDEAGIVETLRFNPNDKVRLEYGKAILDDDPAEAVRVLRQVTEKLNADWRGVYRAHHALSRAYALLGDAAHSDRHAGLCRTANARWPTF